MIRTPGFTLLETLVSLLLLTVAAVSLLHGLQLAFGSYTRIRQHWVEAVERWNEAELFRQGSRPGTPLEVLPEARPLYQLRLESEGQPDGHWEVWRAER